MMKSITVRIALLLLTLCLTFIAIEFLFRVRARNRVAMTVPTKVAGLPYENNAGADYRMDGIRYRFNQLGLRGPETTLQKPKGTYRVLFLGDSVVMGALVKEEKAVAARLQALLGKKRPGPVEVLNAGVTSYNLEFYLTYLKEKGFAFDPDVVLVGICLLNDHLALDKGGVHYDPKKDRETLRVLISKSHFLRYVVSKLRLGALVNLHKITDQEIQSLNGLYEEPETPQAVLDFVKREKYSLSPVVLQIVQKLRDDANWQKTTSIIQGLDKVTRERGVKLGFVIFPIQFQAEVGYRDPEPNLTLIQAARSRSIPIVDLTPHFRNHLKNHPRVRLYAKRGDLSHPGAIGHKIAAETIVKEIFSSH